MKLEYFKYAFDNVRHRRLRSWLTIISILIGIAAIYSLVSFGQGLSNYVDTLSEDMGRDKIIVQSKGIGAAGTDPNFFIPADDVAFLSKVKGIKQIVGIYAKTAEVESDKQKKFVFAMSFPLGEYKNLMTSLMTVELDRGRELKKGDKMKAVLGYNYQLQNKIYKKPLKLNDKILINGHTVEVVGFYQSIGNPQDDSNIYLTEEGILLLYPDIEDKFQFAFGSAEPTADPTEVAERAEDKLRKHKGIDKGKETFYIQTFEQVIEQFSTVLTVINAILVLIALISLIVAGVNIMNTMYTAVLERTQEIGVMKAIGARNSDIMFIFLVESGMLGIVGGVFGIAFGFAVAKTGEAILAGAGYAAFYPIFPWQLTVGCLLFAFLVGALAGLFPARQAARLKPVTALRYE
ncbi:MAG: ABC transporter permease [Candidatus Nanoarchaeia archaeon]